MKLTFLGTGTSHGVPMIGCKCDVCRSTDTRNKRTRSSILIEKDGKNLLFDTATDFHRQAIREEIDRLDAVFYTHAHADHIHGLDEIRIFTRYNPIPIYGAEDTLGELKVRFPYIFNESIQIGGGKPNITSHILKPGEKVEICGADITPIPIKHGKMDIYGYRIGNTAYLTDCSMIPETSVPLLQNLDTLIVGVLRYNPHPTHFCLSESLEAIEKLAPRRAYLTHMSHNFDHETLLKELPANVEPAWDGLAIEE